jgi:hypothetical protein
MTEERLKKLGILKAKALNKDFNTLYDEYKKKAEKAGCHGELRFITEHGRVGIYVVMKLDDF